MAAQFRCEFTVRDAGATGSYSDEIKRVLRDVLDRIDSRTGGSIKDTDGWKIGRWTIR